MIGMNKRKAKSSEDVDFKSNLNKLLEELENEDDEEEEEDILAELKKLQDFDPDAIEQEIIKKRKSHHPSRKDLNNLGLSNKAAKFKMKTAKLLAQQRRDSEQFDLSNLVPTSKPGGL